MRPRHRAATAKRDVCQRTSASREGEQRGATTTGAPPMFQTRSEHADLEQRHLRWIVLPLAALLIFPATVMSLAALA